MEIGQFTRDIRHIAGRLNTGGDYLSRIPKAHTGPTAEQKGTVYQDLAAIEGHKLQATDPKSIAEAQS